SKRLGDLQFPDVDLERLGVLAGQVRERAAEVARLSEEVRVAREELDQAQDELRKTARRGLAYARVYAEGDGALSEQLDALALGKEPDADAPARKRRGRGKARASGSDRAGKDAAKDAAREPTGELPFTGK